MRYLPHTTGIYPILDAQWLAHASCTEPIEFSPEKIVQHLAQLPIGMVQLRCKSSQEEAFSFISLWLELLRHQAPKIKIIINDHVDLALSLQADGVHLGQEDLPIPLCRRLLGPDRIIGLSTHSLTEIRMAESMDVDYLGFGPIFTTQSKSDTQPIQGIEGLSVVTQLTHLPIVAIGGIHLEHLPAIMDAGAYGAAMISALWHPHWSQQLTLACNLWQTASHQKGLTGQV